MGNETTTSGETQADTSETNSEAQAASTTTSQASQAGVSTTTQSTKSAEELERMLAEVRKEAAANRVKLKKYEEDEQKRQEAQLSEQQRLEKRAADAEKALADKEQAYKSRLLDAEVRSQAALLGIKYPDKAVRLIDTASLDLDATDLSAQVIGLLKDLLKEMPEIAGAKPAAPTSGGATNPSRSQTSAPQQWTLDTARPYLADRKLYESLTPEAQASLRRFISQRNLARS